MFSLWRTAQRAVKPSGWLAEHFLVEFVSSQHYGLRSYVTLRQYASYCGSRSYRTDLLQQLTYPSLPIPAIQQAAATVTRHSKVGASTWPRFGAGYADKVRLPEKHGHGVPVVSISAIAEPASEVTKDLVEVPFAVKAYYLGSKIDVVGLRNQAEREGFPAHHHRSVKGNESTVVCMRKGQLQSGEQHATGLPLETYMMAFTYGSVVIFNAHSNLLTKALLTMCHEFTKQRQPDEFTEEMMIRLRPDMEVWSAHSPEFIKLKRLDWSNMRVISSVLGQSVALDFYARNVETMLERFVDMNLEMHKTGSLSASISKDELLKLVAQNNLILTDIISKLGLLDYHDVAWKTSQYGRIWEYLRRDFDVEARFETLSDKLTLVQENLKYYLELRQHQKSDTLEWIIIIMIGAEIAISLYEMSRHLI